jgi:glucose-1-phosphate cytidylyltransferase
MKVVILAGGLGTRLSEETDLRPKPLVHIGSYPIIWHIMKIYSFYGFNDFIICCGYKGYHLKEYFFNYSLHNSNLTFDFVNNKTIIHDNKTESWKVTLVDTGLHSSTGGRLLRVKDYLDDDSDFCFTYGDGLSNINISDLVNFHKTNGTLATMSAVVPPGRYGAVIEKNNIVEKFTEKPQGDNAIINGGFFVLNKKVLKYIIGDNSSWESDALPAIVTDKELKVFKHDGFWQAMDTLREKKLLEELWINDKAPWAVWK